MSAAVHVALGSPGDENATGIVCGAGGRTDAGRELGGAFSMSEGGDGLNVAAGSASFCDRLVLRGVVAGLAESLCVLVRTGVGDGPGGGSTGLSRMGPSPSPGLGAMLGYSISPDGVPTGLGNDVSWCGTASSSATTSTAGSSSFSCRGSAWWVCSCGSSGSTGCFLDFVARVAFVRFVLLAFGFAAAFLLPLVVAVEAVDIMDWTETPLVSIDSSRSGISLMLGASESIVALTDCVDSLVEALDVRDDLDARPFFARGRFVGAVVPAKWKNRHSGDLR